MPQPVKLLIVDDEQHVRSSLSIWFQEEGYQVSLAASGREALSIVAREAPHILLVDIKMPGMDGLELLKKVRELTPDATVLIMTAYASVETAVHALKEGAYDYVVKPFDPEEVSRLVRKAAERYRLLSENRGLRSRLECAAPEVIHAPEGPMQKVTELVAQVAPTDTSVLVTGESGTGKELVARLIHALSPRRFGPLSVVNCGALAEGVLESELFGHERGAFTGAVSRRRGKIELAHEGTLFLDEIGDVPPKVQVDLLRVLEERAVTRVGGNAPVPVDFRLVTATNRDLEEEVAAGRFRQDFFFRIDVFRIHVPPLRERGADVVLLARHFLGQFARQMSKRIDGFTPEAEGALAAYPWPGNVRELQNAIERAVVLCRGEQLGPELFPFAAAEESADLTLSGAEAGHIRKVLALDGYNVARAARDLDIDRVTLYSKMKRYGIARP